MTEQERAAALADDVKELADGYALTDGAFAIYFNKAEWSTIEAALRLLAATPAASSEATGRWVTVRVEDAGGDWLVDKDDAKKAGIPADDTHLKMHMIDDRHAKVWIEKRPATDEVIERVAKAIVAPSSDIRSCDMFDAKRGVSALRPGDEIGDCVLVPKLPTEAMIMAWVGAGGGETVSPALRLGAMRDWSAMISAIAAAKEPTNDRP